MREEIIICGKARTAKEWADWAKWTATSPTGRAVVVDVWTVLAMYAKERK